MWENHRVRPEQASEAVDDLDALVYSPDPASKSGLTDRIVGYSHSFGKVLVVIVLRKDGHYIGINAWPANPTYTRLYREGIDVEDDQ
jgi:hypothetical protein